MIPAMHLVAFHVDEVCLVIAAAEQDKGVVGLTGIVARHTRGIDAGSGMDNRRAPDGDEKNAQHEGPSSHGLITSLFRQGDYLLAHRPWLTGSSPELRRCAKFYPPAALSAPALAQVQPAYLPRSRF